MRKIAALAVAGASALVLPLLGDPAVAADGTRVAPTTQVTLDTSFGQGGIAKLPLSATDSDRFLTTAAGPKGSFYTAGFVTQGTDSAFAVSRVTAAGQLDPKFGTAGTTVVNVAVGGKAAEQARGIALQSNGKIVVVGSAEHAPTAAGDAARDTDAFAVRFNANGQIDKMFGADGIARIDLGAGVATSATAFTGDLAWGVTVRANDELLVVAAMKAEGAALVDADIAVVGLTARGARDRTFGDDGVAVIDVKRGFDSARTAVVQPDGKVVVTGYTRDAAGIVSPVVARLSAQGKPDPTFGAVGIANPQILPSVAESYDVGLQGKRFVIAGYGRSTATEKVDLIATRLRADGSVDTSFATNGLFRLDIAKDDDRARDLVILPGGRILIVGSGKPTATAIEAMAVLLEKDGLPVADFGQNGTLLTDLGGPADSYFGVALSEDGKTVLLVGYMGVDATSGGNDDAVVVRFSTRPRS